MPVRISRSVLVCLGFALLGLSSGVAKAQVVKEFSAGRLPFNSD
jgi:hypothetical protein